MSWGGVNRKDGEGGGGVSARQSTNMGHPFYGKSKNNPISVAFNCSHGDTEDVFQLSPWSPRGLKG